MQDEDLTFRIYSAVASTTANYPEQGETCLYPLLGLVGETGEVAEKIKKLWRNEDKGYTFLFTELDLINLKAELGDVLWYLSQLCSELGTNLDEVATMNMAKLKGRAERNTIKAEGDNR